MYFKTKNILKTKYTFKYIYIRAGHRLLAV